jgi:hypothetical protein
MKKIVSNGLSICVAVFSALQVGHTKKADVNLLATNITKSTGIETTEHGCGCGCANCIPASKTQSDLI